jgi:hypothetical protein
MKENRAQATEPPNTEHESQSAPILEQRGSTTVYGLFLRKPDLTFYHTLGPY